MILVTGGTGFIGRELVRLLVLRDGPEKIMCLTHQGSCSDVETTGRAVLKELGVRTAEAELMTGEGLDILKGHVWESVFHLASCTDTAQPDHSINVVGTQNLLKAIGPLDHRTHFIFTSSIAVNDNRGNYDCPIDEQTPSPVRPCHEYGRKKFLAEQILQSEAKKEGFSLSVVRVCGVYGDGTRRGGLFESAIRLTLTNSLLSRLDWPGKIAIAYVKDVAMFLVEVSGRKSAEAQMELYIPSTESLSLSEMCKIICEAYAKSYRPLKLPGWLWGWGRFVARHKNSWERMLPHGVYNRVWQASVLVNNEYWNEPQKTLAVLRGQCPVKFREYIESNARKGRVL